MNRNLTISMTTEQTLSADEDCKMWLKTTGKSGKFNDALPKYTSNYITASSLNGKKTLK